MPRRTKRAVQTHANRTASGRATAIFVVAAVLTPRAVVPKAANERLEIHEHAGGDFEWTESIRQHLPKTRRHTLRPTGEMKLWAGVLDGARPCGEVMRRLVWLLVVLVIGLTRPVWAQLSPPNELGVSMGHLHYYVRDVDANTRFWVALGGTATSLDTTTVVKFPDVLVFLSAGESSGGTEGSVVNHMAFRVQSLDDRSRGVRVRTFGVRCDIGVHTGRRTYRAV